MEDEIIWDDIIDERWKGWTGQKLHEKWIALRKKNNMLGATHRGEYTAYFAEGLIPHMAPEMVQRLTQSLAPRASTSAS